MEQSRVLELSKGRKLTPDGLAVFYIMSRDQRVKDNHALLEAQNAALNLGLPLVVIFNLHTRLGVRSKEHFEFMLLGLKQVVADLKNLNITFVLTSGEFSKNIIDLSNKCKPAAIYFDFSPLKAPRANAKLIANKISAPCFVVDTHNIIPTWLASDKQEFAAYTMRTKVHKNLKNWLKEPAKLKKHPYTLTKSLSSIDFKQAHEAIANMPTCGIKLDFISGEKAAFSRLDTFISKQLNRYHLDRNDPNIDAQSDLSPYLHFGQISSLRVALELIKVTEEPPLLLLRPKLAEGGPTTSLEDGMNALLEELIVRKELSDNYCFYNLDYRSLKGAPDWAINTLNKHKSDPREFIYSTTQFETAKTHDPAWNAAQNQLLATGKIHGYMRMYWAKKILEWSASPEEAIKIASYLNDKYSIDGGDPNGYVGILWSIAGLHDRPWFERDVYGTIRYMNSGGLERKFDLNQYITKYQAI